MARSGIYKSEVVRARNKLLAMGRYPSIDAIREELGHTGSKATIHRYLKEIEEEEGGKPGTKVAISEALQDLVARLAERLQVEADGRIAELTTKHAEELAAHQHTQEGLQAELTDVRRALEKVQGDLADEEARHRQTGERLQQENVAFASATQQVSDLEDRLRAEEEHRQSLEEKHVHARETLEHFRLASKEQREQEQRQHEQQAQYLQGEIKALQNNLIDAQQQATRSSHENARLASDLSRSERALQETTSELSTLKDLKTLLDSAKQRIERFGHRVAELQAELSAQQARNAELEADQTVSRKEIQQLQVDLAAARAVAETQNQLAEKIHIWIGQSQELSTQAPSPSAR